MTEHEKGITMLKADGPLAELFRSTGGVPTEVEPGEWIGDAAALGMPSSEGAEPELAALAADEHVHGIDPAQGVPAVDAEPEYTAEQSSTPGDGQAKLTGVSEPEPEEPAGAAGRDYVVLVQSTATSDVWVALGVVHAPSRALAWESAKGLWPQELDVTVADGVVMAQVQLVPTRYWQRVDVERDVIESVKGL